MAIDTSRLSNMAGNDEVVANERTRAYVPGNAVAAGSQYGVLWMTGTGVPTSTTGATGTTITAAQFGGGLFIFNSTASAQTVTLDTAANIQTYMNNNSAGIQIGDIISCLVANGGATNTFTIAAGANGSLDTNVAATVPVSTSRMVNIRFTAVGASPTYVVYM
jgi:hypothetical protein